MPLTCAKCSIKQPLTAFGPDSRKQNGKSSWCKKCKAEYQKAYVKERRKDPAIRQKHNESARSSRVAWYGITDDDFDALMELQGGKCAGCGFVPTARRLDIDHKHMKGDKKLAPWERAVNVRGLLCHLCNRVLGILRDNPETFQRLANYLNNPPAVVVVLPKIQQTLDYLDRWERRKELWNSMDAVQRPMSPALVKLPDEV